MRDATDDLRWGVIFSFSGYLCNCLEYALGLHTARIDLARRHAAAVPA